MHNSRKVDCYLKPEKLFYIPRNKNNDHPIQWIDLGIHFRSDSKGFGFVFCFPE